MEIDARSLQVLLEAGFLAVGYGYMREAEVIFDGLRAIRPDNESPLIGLAFARMSSNEMEEAIRILEHEALKVNPESDLALSFLGLALKMAGRHEQCRPILNEVLERNGDEAAVKLAREILEEISPG